MKSLQSTPSSASPLEVPPSNSLTWFDIPLGILCGLLWTLLCCDWLAHFHTASDAVFYADLIEYCNGISTKDLLGVGASNKRSAFAMQLPRAFVEREGIFDALALGAIWGQIGIGACLYWWGGLVGGRRMAIATLLLAGVAAPMTFISRVLSSYPAMSLCFVFGAMSTLWAIQSRKFLPTWIAGTGIGCTLLADARGIVWALPWMGGLALSILLRDGIQRHWLHKCGRLICLGIPIWWSHTSASTFYVFDAIGLESQVDIRPSLYHWLRIYPPPYDYASNYTWGMAPLSDLPKTLQFLWEQTQLEVPPSAREDGLRLGRAIARFYWEWAVLGVGVACLSFWRHKWKLLALLCSVCPFVMTFHGALTMLEEHIRFYIQTLPGIILLWAVLWERGSVLWSYPWLKLTQRWNPLLRNPTQWIVTVFLPLYLLYHLVLGSIDSPLSPNASWRRDWDPQPNDFGDILSHYNDGRMMSHNGIEACGRGIQRTEALNKPMHTTLYENGLHRHLDSIWQSAFSWKE